MAKNSSALTLILSAMPSEIRLIQARMEPGAKTGTLAVFPYKEGILQGRRVITAVTGVGVTNGAMVAALFIEKFKPAELIVSGTGSRFNPRIRTGDTVISTRTIHHAAGSLTDAGMVYRKVRGPLEGQMTHYQFAPDARLLRLAKAAISGYQADPVTVNGETYRPAVLTGVVTASDLFGVSDAKIADMKAKLDPDIMEMESAAIAQVCEQLGTPHIVFRAGSNRTQSNPGSDYRKLGQTAAHAAARWTVYFVGCLAAHDRAKRQSAAAVRRKPVSSK
jgi:adenosylhomocysteine nucleosidase